jgi:putative addiction module component (TIGR02574 family)
MVDINEVESLLTTVNLKQLLELPEDDRRTISDFLWQSLPENAIPPLSQEWKDELDRRIAAHEADPSTGIPWEEVLARLQAKYP